jgi:hypothetical protein
LNFGRAANLNSEKENIRFHRKCRLRNATLGGEVMCRKLVICLGNFELAGTEWNVFAHSGGGGVLEYR